MRLRPATGTGGADRVAVDRPPLILVTFFTRGRADLAARSRGARGRADALVAAKDPSVASAAAMQEQEKQ